MEKTATLNLRVNPETKKKAEEVLSILGIPMSTAIDIYLRQIWLKGGIPFPLVVSTPPKEINMDLMTEEELHQKLEAGYQDAMAGRVRNAKEAFVDFRKGIRGENG